MMADECKETYKECMAAHKARYQAVIDTRKPWETVNDLAERAGCGHATIERLLQSPSGEVDCNKPPKIPWSQAQEDEPEVQAFIRALAKLSMEQRMFVAQHILKRYSIY